VTHPAVGDTSKIYIVPIAYEARFDKIIGESDW
jgi:hypothetical protein